MKLFWNTIKWDFFYWSINPSLAQKYPQQIHQIWSVFHFPQCIKMFSHTLRPLPCFSVSWKSPPVSILGHGGHWCVKASCRFTLQWAGTGHSALVSRSPSQNIHPLLQMSRKRVYVRGNTLDFPKITHHLQASTADTTVIFILGLIWFLPTWRGGSDVVKPSWRFIHPQNFSCRPAQSTKAYDSIWRAGHWVTLSCQYKPLQN